MIVLPVSKIVQKHWGKAFHAIYSRHRNSITGDVSGHGSSNGPLRLVPFLFTTNLLNNSGMYQCRFRSSLGHSNSDTHRKTEDRTKTMYSQIALLQDDGDENDESIVENYNRLPMSLGDDILSVDVGEDGQYISITVCMESCNDSNPGVYASDTFEFSSPLLWVNDPDYIHPTSGQRIRTLGQYSRNYGIVNARIIRRSRSRTMNLECSEDLKQLHPRPPKGSLHSRGGVYELSGLNKRCKNGNDRSLVVLEWSHGEQSMFDLDWLIDHGRNNYLGRSLSSHTDGFDNESETKQARWPRSTALKPTTAVTKDIAIGHDSLSTYDYTDVMKSEKTLLESMQDIFEHGAILIRNAPDMRSSETQYDFEQFPPVGGALQKTAPGAIESVVAELGRRFSGGSLSHGTLYGDVFHVKAKSNAENIAYTNVALPPHQDLTYYESKPFLQLLHCVTNGNESSAGRIIGGESILIDAMAAAEEFRVIAPDLFDTLCQVEATFIKERHDVDMVSPKPHIVVDPTFNQVVEVNWSPPFEGLLEMNPRIPVVDYVRAYQGFERMLDDGCETKGSNPSLLPESLEKVLRSYAKNYTWEHSLKKGEILVFNNQRMLHGRRSFESIGRIQRHLIGCYTDAMETTSRYRCLLRNRESKNGVGYGLRNHGSGCRWM